MDRRRHPARCGRMPMPMQMPPTRRRSCWRCRQLRWGWTLRTPLATVAGCWLNSQRRRRRQEPSARDREEERPRGPPIQQSLLLHHQRRIVWNWRGEEQQLRRHRRRLPERWPPTGRNPTSCAVQVQKRQIRCSADGREVGSWTTRCAFFASRRLGIYHRRLWKRWRGRKRTPGSIEGRVDSPVQKFRKMWEGVQ